MNFKSALKAGKHLIFMLGMLGIMQVIPSTALAAGYKVNSVLAIQYDNDTFIATVLAQGPQPIMNVDIKVDGNLLDNFKEDRFVLYPKLNLTLFKFTKKGTIAQPGSQVTAIINDGVTQKTVTCSKGQLFHQLVVCH